MIVGPLAHHDRDGFAIHGYALGPRDDSPWSKRIDAAVDSVTDLAGLTPLAAAERIRADGIDILVDLMGYTSGGRPEIAALRPAPLQALWLGFPGTAGGAAYDYLIADRIVAPPEFQPHCAERIAWLPHCYLPTDPQQAIAETPEDRQAAGLPAEGTIFVSLNQPFKLEPTLWSVWMEILRAVPGSHLWLRPKGERAAAHLRAAAEAAGIDPTRLIALERLPDKTQHLRRLSFADLALDTRLYNGHVTTLDALWAGLPTLALAGRHMASRGSMSALTALDMEELIAGDLAAYRDLAIALGRDGVRRQALRTKLATRLRQRPLFDAQAFARDLEALYRGLWRQALAGKRADGPISAEAEDRKAS